MDKENKVLIMLIGKTHCGKTTFAKELKGQVANLIILEADPIAVFMKEQFPELRGLDDQEHNGNFNNVSLKYRTFLLFLEFALSLGRPIILSNSNMWQKGREMVFDLCKKFGYKAIGLYFDFPEELVLSRAEVSDRSLNVLRTSKSFQDLIINQRSRMQPPESSEFETLFTAKSPEELSKIKEDLIKVLK